MRIQKYLAAHLSIGRRTAEAYIQEGRVFKNGIKARLGESMDEYKDIIELDGNTVKGNEEKMYIAFHKPKGVVTTKKDTHGRKTVMDMLPREYKIAVPVGRLDKDSEGLLFLSNDGEFVQQLTHPRFGCTKTYMVKTQGHWKKEEIKKCQSGLKIEGEFLQPMDVSIFLETDEASVLIFVLKEGKNRQIRRVCDSFGHRVISLKRIGVGDITLQGIAAGEYRTLRKKEVELFMNDV